MRAGEKRTSDGAADPSAGREIPHGTDENADADATGDSSDSGHEAGADTAREGDERAQRARPTPQQPTRGARSERHPR